MRSKTWIRLSTRGPPADSASTMAEISARSLSSAGHGLLGAQQLHGAHGARRQHLGMALPVGQRQVARGQRDGQLVIQRVRGGGAAADPIVDLRERRRPAPRGTRAATARNRSKSRAARSRDSSRGSLRASVRRRARRCAPRRRGPWPSRRIRCSLRRLLQLRREARVAEQERQAAVPQEDLALEGGDQLDLVQPPMAPDVIEKRLLEEHACAARPARPCRARTRAAAGRPSRRRNPPILGQRVVQVWHETHCQMESARSAESHVAELQQADQPRRRHIHVRRHGASGRAFAALVTLRQAAYGSGILFGRWLAPDRKWFPWPLSA